EEEAAIGRGVGDTACISGGTVSANVCGADPPDAESTVKKALQPDEIDVEEAQRAGREFFFTRYQVVKRDMFEGEEVREPFRDHIGKIGGDAVVGGVRQVAGGNLNLVHLLSKRALP